MDPKRTCSWLVANDTILESDSSDGAKIRFCYQNCFTRVHPLFPHKKTSFSTGWCWLAGCDGQPVNSRENRTTGLTDRLFGLEQPHLVTSRTPKPSHRLLSHLVSAANQQMATALTQAPVVWLSWWTRTGTSRTEWIETTSSDAMKWGPRNGELRQKRVI